jgi:DNA-binding MarR family transcriptional regulator
MGSIITEYPEGRGTMSATELKQQEQNRGSWEAVRDLPPSAKLVAKVLEYNDTLTQSQLAEETLLPPRTVRYALNRLEEENAVHSRFSFSDARKRLYTLTIE